MKRRVFITAAALIVLTAIGSAQDQKGKTELEGTWEIIGRSFDGSSYTDEDVKAMLVRRLVFRGNKLLALDKMGKVKNETTFKLDPKQRHPTIDFVCQDLADPTGTLVTKGIYWLRGDTLTMCYQLGPEAQRPKDFDDAPGSFLEILTLNRVKE